MVFLLRIGAFALDRFCKGRCAVQCILPHVSLPNACAKVFHLP